MTKQMNGPIDLPNGHDSATPLLDGGEPKPRISAGEQQDAFRALAQRLYTDRSVQRFEAALRALLLPVKKPPRDEAKVLPPTHSPES